MTNETARAYLRVGSRRVRIPRRRGTRIALGLWLTIGGALPIPPGYVFIPVGLAILSIDFPRLRRWRRRLAVGMGRRRAKPSGRTPDALSLSASMPILRHGRR
ncbi:hypothetical protein MTR66_18700 [Novosphingobium sp. 2638]|uniref:Transmembrane protein PGPGW n=2 Tax=Novosphingobium beihaiensis TaxID=2930389 RepID=A0ABT0BUX9_9SPHN|nr:hypothetical protein [Novosphingobium beihaiensis]